MAIVCGIGNAPSHEETLCLFPIWLLFYNFFYLLVIRCHPSVQSEIKRIYPSTLRLMCAVLIIVNCSSTTDEWRGSNWIFLSKSLLIFPNAPITTGNICPQLPRSPGLITYLVFQVNLCQHLNYLIWLYQSVGKSSLFCHTVSGRFASIFRSVISYTFHIKVIPLAFIALSGVFVLPYSTFYMYWQLFVTWRSSNDNAYWMFHLGLLLLYPPFLPLGLSYINTSGIFLYLLIFFQGPGGIVRALVSSWVLQSSHFQFWTYEYVDSWYFVQQFLMSYIFAVLV